MYSTGRGRAHAIVLRWFMAQKIALGREECTRAERRCVGPIEAWWTSFPMAERDLIPCVNTQMDMAEGIRWRMVGGRRVAEQITVPKSFTTMPAISATQQAVIQYVRSALLTQMGTMREAVRDKLNIRVFFLLMKLWQYDGIEQAKADGYWYDMQPGPDEIDWFDVPLAQVCDDDAEADVIERTEVAN